MRAIEQNPGQLETGLNASLRFAALAGLGSKYLAVGTPTTMGIIDCGEHAAFLIECHSLLFGPLEILRGEELGCEEAMAADIVCLTSSSEFDLDWIAEATHLNVLDTGPWSTGMQALAQTSSLTYIDIATRGPHNSHGLLADVIVGTVSGRMGEELTALVA